MTGNQIYPLLMFNVHLLPSRNMAMKAYQKFPSGSCKGYKTLLEAKHTWNANTKVDGSEAEEYCQQSPIKDSNAPTQMYSSSNTTSWHSPMKGKSLMAASTTNSNTAAASEDYWVSDSSNMTSRHAPTKGKSLMTASTTDSNAAMASGDYWVVIRGKNPGVFLGQ